METQIVIESANELIRLAADPNVTVRPTDTLAREACAILEQRAEQAEKVGGRQMVTELRFVRAVAGRLAESIQSKPLRSRVLSLADGYSDDHLLWLLASRVLNEEQLSEIRNAIAPSA